MSLSKIIGFASAALALYFYKKSADVEEQSALDKKEHEQYVSVLLEEKRELQDKIDPNVNANQSPVVFTATVRSGGQMLEQTEVVLNCTNTSDSVVEIGDFQAYIYVAGYKSDMCIPANISRIKLAAKQSKSFVLYAGYGRLFRNYNEVKKALNALYDGRVQSFMRAGMFIPMSKNPVVLDMQYIWYSKYGEDECFVYNVPASFRWKYAGWVAGHVGYNAGKAKEQQKNPSYWVDTTSLEDKENNE